MSQHIIDPDVTIVIVSWNTMELLRQCIESVVRETKIASYEIIVVDNASSDGSVGMLHVSFPSVIVIENAENIGFVAANNIAFERARGRYVLLLNSDTLLLDDAVSKTIMRADSIPDGAVFGCKVLNADRTIQRTCFMYPSPLNMLIQSTYLYKLFPKSRFFGREFMTWWDYSAERDVETISGCFSLVRREALAQVGPMDPVYFFYGDDPDWCFRFRKAGWRVVFVPDGSIIHYGGQSSKIKKRAFRLQLSGSQLIFGRLHRNRASFMAMRLLTANFFLARVPFWAIKYIVDRGHRAVHAETLGTYLRGAWYSLFDWKGLVMNRNYLERRLTS